MMTKPSVDEIRYVVQLGKDACTPEKARDALRTVGTVLGGAEVEKCRQLSQTLGDKEVMKLCRDTVVSIEKKSGLAAPWWKFW